MSRRGVGMLSAVWLFRAGFRFWPKCPGDEPAYRGIGRVEKEDDFAPLPGQGLQHTAHCLRGITHGNQVAGQSAHKGSHAAGRMQQACECKLRQM